MKKLIAMLLALVMVCCLFGCGNTDTAGTTTTAATTEATEESAGSTIDADAVMSYEQFANTEMDGEVTVETYIQAVESWWEGKVQLYTQTDDGAYYIYDLACSEEEAAKLVPGTKIRVRGYKAEWSGEIEIVDAAYQILDAEPKTYEATDVTALMGTDALADEMNKLVAIKGLTVAASKVKNADGEEVEHAYLYKWDGSGEQGDDLYFNVSLGDQVYTFTVNAYMDGTGPDSDVYKAVEALNVGDKIDIEGFLYWYNAAQPHVTAIAKAQ